MFLIVLLTGVTLSAVFADAGGLGGFILSGLSALSTVALLGFI